MKLALGQIQIEDGEVSANRERALGAVQRAATRGADLFVLPEMFTVGYFAFETYARSAEPLDGTTITAIQEAAQEHDIAIVAGSFVEDLAASTARGFDTPAEDGYANTSVVVDESGQRCGVYRKRHLFGYGSDEQQLLEPGESLCTVEYGGFTLGVTTCYDLRFPQLYRRLVDAGVTLVVVPSAWPYPRVEHWKTLPRARAIENLLYVVTVNGSGSFEDTTLLGRSTVYDPWGTSIAAAGEAPTLVTAQIDPETVQTYRSEFPALADRRL